MPPKSLEEALAALALPDEAKQKIAQLDIDPPPSGKYEIWGDAVAAREIKPGQSEESLLLKTQRMGLWGLAYFPMQFLPHYRHLGWAGVGVGSKVSQEGQEVSRFKKDRRKYYLMFEDLCILVVSYITQRATADHRSVDGFRLTASGDDYYREVTLRNERKASGALRNFNHSIDERRIRASDIKDPALLQRFLKGREVSEDLSSDGFMEYFDRLQIRQLTDGKKGK